MPPPASLSRRTLLAAAVGTAMTACTAPPPPSPPPTPTPAPPSGPDGWVPDLLQVAPDGRLGYRSKDGHRLPDFGAAGYRGGRDPLPDVVVVHTVGPIPGDNPAHLQQAIDHVAGLPRDREGFRGALLLRPGVYEVAGTLTVAAGGVVVRGAGDGDSSDDTILRAVGDTPHGRDVIVLGSRGSWRGALPGTRTDLTTDLVPVGTTTVGVADPSGLRADHLVVVTHPCTREWLRAVGGGGTRRDDPWEQDSVPITHLRRVTDVSGHDVTLDAPLFYDLDRSVSPGSLHAWDAAGLVTQVGLEDLRVDIVTTGGAEDEDHAETGVRITNVRDGWVRGCTVLHFTKAGFLTIGTSQTTITGCHALDPVSRITGGRRYNFDAEERSQLVLFTDCHATEARHAFIVNGASSASGIVFHRTTATGGHASSEGHRLWSQGLLFDNHREIDPRTDRAVLLGSRGDYGTGHGWSAVNSVAWQVDAGGAGVVVQRPPTAQNYAIGCRNGRVDGNGPFDERTGHIEGTGRRGLTPASLFEAQRIDRTR